MNNDDSSVSHDDQTKLPENQLIDPSELAELKSEYQDDFFIDDTKRKSL